MTEGFLEPSFLSALAMGPLALRELDISRCVLMGEGRLMVDKGGLGLWRSPSARG